MGPPPFSGSKHSKLALNEHSESGHQKNAQKLVAHSWQKIRKASNPKTPKPQNPMRQDFHSQPWKVGRNRIRKTWRGEHSSKVFAKFYAQNIGLEIINMEDSC